MVGLGVRCTGIVAIIACCKSMQKLWVINSLQVKYPAVQVVNTGIYAIA